VDDSIEIYSCSKSIKPKTYVYLHSSHEEVAFLIHVNVYAYVDCLFRQFERSILLIIDDIYVVGLTLADTFRKYIKHTLVEHIAKRMFKPK